MKRIVLCVGLLIALILVILVVSKMPLFSINAVPVSTPYNVNGDTAGFAFDYNGNQVFPDGEGIPVPSGDLTASQTIRLPDLYEAGKGFTCTGLAFDGEFFYIGDIGALSGTNYRSQIVATRDFVTVERTIPLYSIYSGFRIVQGVAYDASNDSLWCVDADGSKIYNLTKAGEPISSFAYSRPTGIACAQDGSLWVLDYSNKIKNLSKTGTVIASFDFAYSETLDQCFLDDSRGLIYITAGVNYSGRNNVYCFNTNTHEQSIACTVDSYSVEGIWLGNGTMIIVNDGLYHDAAAKQNQANFYVL